MKKGRQTPNRQYPSNRKVKGFGYYLMSNDKLSKTNRENFITQGNIYISNIVDGLNLTTSDEVIRKGIPGELDPKLTDWELMDIFNDLYDKYGYLVPKFKEKWEKERIPKKGKTLKKGNPKGFKKEIQELETRIQNLELRIKSLELKSKGLIQGSLGF